MRLSQFKISQAKELGAGNLTTHRRRWSASVRKGN